MALLGFHWIKKYERPDTDPEYIELGQNGDADAEGAEEVSGADAADEAVTESEEAADPETATETQPENETTAAGVSSRGRVVSRMISYISNESKLGKSLKTGELRKKMQEPAWTVPAPFNMTSFDLENFSLKMLSSKENPDLEHVILQLHGGGYMGAIRNAYYVFAGLYNELSHGMNVCCPDYRVAPEDPYPAALEDAYASYKWLMTRGYKPENIVLAGDSAGGGLSMALTMYLRDQGEPLPGGIIAMSPWTDLTASGETYESNFDKDPLYGGTKESLIYINAYPGEHDKKDPYISPAFGSFEGFPPMLIQVGSNEMLLSDSETVASKAREAGVKVRLSIYEGMFHVFQMAYTAIPESKKAWMEAGKFLDILYGGD
jgi:acetyl esterase/lipase